MAKKSDNKKQQAKASKQDRTQTKAKGAKGGATSKGAQRAAAAQRAELKGMMDAARESAEVLREAASVLSQSAAQSAAQTAAQARWGTFPGQGMGFPSGAMASDQAAANAAMPVPAPQPATPAAEAVPVAVPILDPVVETPAASRPALQPTAQPQQPAQVQQLQTLQPAVAQAQPVPQQSIPDPAPQVASQVQTLAQAQSQAQTQAQSQAQAPAQAQVQPQSPVQSQVQPTAQTTSYPVQQVPPSQPALASQPYSGGFQADPTPYQPEATMAYQPEPITRVAHNESMGTQVGFMPKEPEEKAGRRWGSPIKSLKSAVAALANRSEPEPEPEPEPYVPARAQIDYTPKPELLVNLPKFGDGPAVLPSPQELLASVPGISATGQVMPVGGQAGVAGRWGESVSMPTAYGGSPSVSLDLPPVQEQIIEVPAQDVVYGEVQMPDPYLQAYDGMQAYDPQYDPNAMRAYDPMQQIQMQVYDPTQAAQQAWDPYGQQHAQDPYGQPMQQDPYGQQMYQQDPYGQQMQPQQDYQAAAQSFDPSMYGHGFDQAAQYDPYGYGNYDPYAEAPLYPMEPVKGGKATASLILGILSILLAFIPPLGLILAVVAILLSKSYVKAGGMAPRAGTGRVCGIVGIVLSLLLAVALGVFLAYFYGGLYGESNAGAIMGYLQTTPLKGFL